MAALKLPRSRDEFIEMFDEEIGNGFPHLRASARIPYGSGITLLFEHPKLSRYNFTTRLTLNQARAYLAWSRTLVRYAPSPVRYLRHLVRRERGKQMSDRVAMKAASTFEKRGLCELAAYKERAKVYRSVIARKNAAMEEMARWA